MNPKISAGLIYLLLIMLLSIMLFLPPTPAWHTVAILLVLCCLWLNYHLMKKATVAAMPEHVYQQRFMQLTENSEQIFWLEQPLKGKVLYVSPAYERIWGVSRQDLFSNHLAWQQYVHPNDLDKVRQQRSAALKIPQLLTYRIIRPDGQTRWISERLFPVWADEGEQIQQLAGVANDITDQYQLQVQLAQSQKMESLGKLTGGIAHDFNNLLTVIMGNAELLVDKLGIQHPLHQVGAMIVKAAERGASLNQQLLAFASKQQLQPVAVRLTDLVNDTVGLLKRTLPLHLSLKLENNYPECVVYVDAGQLQNALLNLCLNAKDALGQTGEIVIRLSPQIQQGQKQHMVALAVVDNGCGIEANQLDKIFEPFYTTKTAAHSTGLGLSMVYGFVKQSAGYIDVVSEVERGTTITLYLPVHQEAKVGLPPNDDTVAESGLLQRILLVEDDLFVRDSATRMLADSGFEVVAVSSADEALALLKRDAAFELLFTDVVMPGSLNGMRLAELVKQDFPHIQLLLTSGYMGKLPQQRSPYTERNVLIKPYSKAGLQEHIRKVLKQKAI